jgi:hypothetical protein
MFTIDLRTIGYGRALCAIFYKIGHGSNSGIQEFRNLGIEGILSVLIY